MKNVINKPFIHLFKSCIGNCYVYDVNKDKIVAIPFDLYNYLDGNSEYSEMSSTSKSILQNLISKGYLKDNPIKLVEHPCTNDLKYQLNNNIRQIVLQITQSCNLMCGYCPYASTHTNKNSRSHSNKAMSWEIAKGALDFFADHTSNRNNVVVSFYGGEPLLEFELIKKCVEYSEMIFRGKNIEYHLTTNGTIINDEILAFVYEHKIHIMFSIDGPEKIHNIHRKFYNGKGSFFAAFETLSKIVKKYGEHAKEYVSINTVIDPNNDIDIVMQLFDNSLLKNNDIPITAAIVDYEYDLECKQDTPPEFIEKINYLYFLGALKYLRIIDDISVPPFISDYFQSINKNKLHSEKVLKETAAPTGPCIPGQRRLFVNVDGQFFPCERVSEVSQIMNIGNIVKGFDIDKASNILNVSQISAEQCKSCWAFWHCTACARIADNNGVFSAKIKSEHCKDIKSTWESEMLDRVMLKEIANMKRSRG